MTLDTTQLVSAETPAAEHKRAIPDGIGMSLKDIQALMVEHHGYKLPDDDPVLQVVTICNAFLGEINKLQAHHREALSRVMAEQSENYANTVQQQLDGLSQSLSSVTVEGMRTVFDAHTSRMQTIKGELLGLALLICGSTIVNVVVLALRAKF
jgi:hypothetical protein